jgi:hypothetical protein
VGALLAALVIPLLGAVVLRVAVAPEAAITVAF